MKKIIILCLVFYIFKFYAQEYRLKTSAFDVPDNAYIKDTFNEYDNYVGLWKGDWNGKAVYIELKKVKYFNNGIHPYYRDEIIGERKIISANGTVEIDRISNFDYHHPEIFGTGLPTGINGLTYPNSLMFYPKNMCDKFARLVVTKITSTQMTLHFVYEPSFYDENCIHNNYVDQHDGDFPINFPKDIVLTKQ